MREMFRVWMEYFETSFLEIILEERPGTRAAIVRTLLYGFSKVFEVAIKTRRFLRLIREWLSGDGGRPL
jgi:hypothetical protein